MKDIVTGDNEDTFPVGDGSFVTGIKSSRNLTVNPGDQIMVNTRVCMAVELVRESIVSISGDILDVLHYKPV
jgi:hypothetical protein